MELYNVMLKKSILEKILASMARSVVQTYRPIIIGVTGSVGKTSTRLAIAAVLGKKYRVRTAVKNYNTEIGLPLTILGLPHYGRNVLSWFFGFVRVYAKFILTLSEYPEVLVLEYGIDKPGDMDKLLAIAKPNIAVVTAIGDVPAHVEFFNDVQEVIEEKRKIVEALSSDGTAILNHDDYAVFDMQEKTHAHVVTFGFEENARVRITNYALRTTKDEQLGDIPQGIGFKLTYGGSTVPVRLDHTFGEPQAYSAAAAASAGTRGSNR